MTEKLKYKRTAWSSRATAVALVGVLSIAAAALASLTFSGMLLAAGSPPAPTIQSGPASSSAPFTPPAAPLAGAGTFEITATPSTNQIFPGYADSYAIKVTPKNGFTGTVNFSLSPALPSGMSVLWTAGPQVSITGTAAVTTTLIVNSTGSLAIANYNFTLTGTSGAITDPTPIKVEVKPFPAKYYTLSLAPSSQPLAPGSPAVYTVTVNRFGLNDKVDLKIDGILPAGVTASFNPPSVPSPPKSQTSTLTLTTTQPVSAFPFAVSGQSGGYNIDVVGGATSAVATTILVSSGSPQSATVNTNFANALVALVKDQFGNPIAGVTVTFTAPSTGASGTFANNTATTTAVTNGSGLATSSTFKANTVAGSYNVAASASGTNTTNFALTNNAGTAASIAVSSGSGQTATVNTNFTNALVALVSDQFGNPVPGATVTFTPPASGASGSFLGGATAISNASGLATSSTFKANTVAGSYNFSASTGATSTNFALTNVAGSAPTIAVQSGSPQSATVGNNFTAPLAAVVTDLYGNPVQGVTVTFTPPASGASGSFASGNTATTNSSGVATSSTFQANTVAGSYNVNASAPGTSTVHFALTNVPGGASKLVFTTLPYTTGAGISTGVITVQRQDSFGNPVTTGSLTINLATSASSSGTFRSADDSIQITQVFLSSGFSSGDIRYRDVATGTPQITASDAASALLPAAQQETITAGPPTTIFIANSDQSTQVGTAFTNPLKALVTDAYDNPVPGVTVTWTAPGSGASGTFANSTAMTSTSTNAAGVASSTTFTANTVAGTYSVAVSSPGLTTAFAHETNLPGPANKLAWVQQPSNANTNAAINPAPSVQVQDQYGNAVGGSGRLVTMMIVTGPGTFASGATASTNASGLATFSNLALDSDGTYTINATSSGLNDSPASVSFTITNPAQPYTISGVVPQPLTPGMQAQQIPITFNSPNQGNGGSGANGTQVSNLTVSISSISGGSPGPNPCTTADFVLTQVPAAAYPFYLPFGNSTLASIIGSGNLPTIRMIDRQDTVPGDHSGNQNACKSATVNLTFTGTP